ncbi:MAG: hypothetical protein IAE82_03095 [Opitutaceae bacterium]|nr:hypothetical protein [Opitutaceae bacterium]
MNRTKIISRLPGVQLAPGEKRFGSGRPKLEAEDAASFPVPAHKRAASGSGGWLRR